MDGTLCYGSVRGLAAQRRGEGKRFFFEKKNQKTFFLSASLF
jgi:hypothetical protein